MVQFTHATVLMNRTQKQKESI